MRIFALRTPPDSPPSMGRVLCLALCFLPAVFAPAIAQTAPPPLAQGPAGAVSDADLLAQAAASVPDELRAAVLSRADQSRQLAANIYIQRAMAQEAERQGLAQNPQAQAALALARDKALADLYLADFDQRQQPADAALLAYAQTSYRALDGKRLQAPERSRVRHLLRKDKSPESRAQIERWLADAKAGKDFAQLAREHSDDSASAARGGDLGFISAGGTVPAFEQAVAALANPGDLSEVVETPFGYHLIRLEERRPAGKRGFDELRETLLTQARSALLDEARARDAQRLEAAMQVDEAALAAFSARFKAPDAAAP